jgi:hypothetical protein
MSLFRRIALSLALAICISAAATQPTAAATLGLHTAQTQAECVNAISGIIQPTVDAGKAVVANDGGVSASQAFLAYVTASQKIETQFGDKNCGDVNIAGGLSLYESKALSGLTLIAALDTTNAAAYQDAVTLQLTRSGQFAKNIAFVAGLATPEAGSTPVASISLANMPNSATCTDSNFVGAVSEFMKSLDGTLETFKTPQDISTLGKTFVGINTARQKLTDANVAPECKFLQLTTLVTLANALDFLGLSAVSTVYPNDAAYPKMISGQVARVLDFRQRVQVVLDLATPAAR